MATYAPPTKKPTPAPPVAAKKAATGPIRTGVNGRRPAAASFWGFSVARPMVPAPMMSRLGVTQPSGRAERAADALAAHAVSSSPASPGSADAAMSVAPHEASTELPPIDGSRGRRVAGALAGGTPLPDQTRELFESRLGVDLSDVRVHDGQAPDDAAQALGARAFTRGSDVVFGAGEYSPTTTGGTRLLAHEIAHVLQQREARAIGGPPVIQREVNPAHDLVKQFTSFGNLDEGGLGAELVRRAASGTYEFVQNVLDDLGSSDRDDVCLGFIEAASNALLGELVSQHRGRLLLDRLYDELTAGLVGDDEQKQANRILRVKSQQTSPSIFAAAATSGAIKIFPFRIPGPTVFHDSPIEAKRTGTGGVHVKLMVRALGTDEFRGETRTLPTEVFTRGIILPADEVIGVRLYDLGGPIKYAPALFLVELSHQTDTKTLEKVAAITAVGLTLGTGALASLGVEASALARVLLIADRVAATIGVLSLVINDHRGWILSTFGAEGATFLRIWDVVESITALYGFGRVALSTPKVINALRNAYRNWKSVTQTATSLSTGERNVISQIEQQTEDVLRNAEEIQGSTQSGTKPGPGDQAGPSPPSASSLEQAPSSAEARPKAMETVSVTPESEAIPADISRTLRELPEADQARILARVARRDAKGRPFGTPRNPRLPTIEEFNPQVEMIPAGELKNRIVKTRHGLFPEQVESVQQLSNDQLVRFRIEDPISASRGPEGLSLTGGHHRTAEVAKRVASGRLKAESLIPVLIHD